MVPAIVGRISYTGDLGCELWCRSDFQAQLYDQLVDAGADLGLRHFGVRALNGLRLEKSYGSWAREYRPIYGPFAAGLGRFVALDKADFIGRTAALAYVPADRAGDEGAGAFQVEILGDRPPATIAPRPLFDPDGARIWS